jgi:quercetin dioxygenase-like cupin family protein
MTDRQITILTSSEAKQTMEVPSAGNKTVHTYRFLATGKETNGKYFLFEAIIPSGGGTPPHLHRYEEEAFYVLDGEIIVAANDTRYIAKAGTFVNIPKGTPHHFCNETEQPARILILFAPAGMDEMFVKANAEYVTNQDWERVEKILDQYGMEYVDAE